jgi:hypothetical protein
MTDQPELSDYLLGECSAEERERFARRLAAEPGLRAQADRLAPIVERLGGLPPAAWQSTTSASPAPDAHIRRPLGLSRRAAPRLVAGLAALVMFGAGIGAGVLLKTSGAQTGPALALEPLAGEPASASGVARLVGAQRLVLDVAHLPPTPAGTYYEAWLMSSARDLVPLVSFTVDRQGRAELELRLPAPSTRYRYFDISLQRAAAGTAHSGTSVLRGPTARS